VRALLSTVVVALALAASSSATTCGATCNGGGYDQLPTCGPVFYGVTLYVQAHFWRCVRGTPDHWILVG